MFLPPFNCLSCYNFLAAGLEGVMLMSEPTLSQVYELLLDIQKRLIAIEECCQKPTHQTDMQKAEKPHREVSVTVI